MPKIIMRTMSLYLTNGIIVKITKLMHGMV